MLTFQQISDILAYDQATGFFTWKKRAAPCVWVGDVAGAVERNGYRRITIGKRRFLAHRLAWLLSTGEWPVIDIDHANGDKDDNRISNLRLTTKSQNAANKKRPATNKSGFKGVCRVGQKWQAGIKVNGKSLHLGWHDTPEAAHAAYLAAAQSAFGDFARAA